MKNIHNVVCSILLFPAMALVAPVAQADTFKLRIASGHPPANTLVDLTQNFFVPEVTKRVAARTKHKIEFYTPPKDVVAELQKKMVPYWESWAKQHGKDTEAMLKEVRASLGK